MEIDLIFKIAAVGVMVSILNAILTKSGREEQAMLTTLAGLIIVLLIIVKQVADLFQTVKTIFKF